MVRNFIRAGIFSARGGGTPGTVTDGGATTGSGGGGGGGGTPGPAGFTAVWGTRPSHARIALSGVSNQTISGYSFAGITNGAITLDYCSNIIIEQNDFDTVSVPILITNSNHITVRYNRARNVTGPGTTQYGNFCQMGYCGPGMYVGHNIMIDGFTEDWISTYQCNGSQTDPIIIEYNQIKSYTYTSRSGSAIQLGDSGGSWQVARYNLIDGGGQGGIGESNGTNVTIDHNTVFSNQYVNSNLAIGVAYFTLGTPPAGITVSNNRVNWLNSAGQQNSFWTDGSAGTIAGQSTNRFGDTTLTEPTILITGAAI